MKYFKMEEFIASPTAKAKKIDNTPNEAEKKHLEELVDTILDPLRAAWGSGIRINSGYRGPALNKAVGGSSTSAHCYGYAADLYPSNGKIAEFKDFVKKFLKTKGIKFDQYINEYSGASQWVHIGVRNGAGKQRGQYLVYKGGKYYYA